MTTLTALTVELLLGASGWVDVTARHKATAGTSFTGGRADEYGDIVPATCSLTLANGDGALTPRSVASPYYPDVRSGEVRGRVRAVLDTGTVATPLDRQIELPEPLVSDHPQTVPGQDEVVRLLSQLHLSSLLYFREEPHSDRLMGKKPVWPGGWSRGGDAAEMIRRDAAREAGIAARCSVFASLSPDMAARARDASRTGLRSPWSAPGTTTPSSPTPTPTVGCWKQARPFLRSCRRTSRVARWTARSCCSPLTTRPAGQETT